MNFKQNTFSSKLQSLLRNESFRNIADLYWRRRWILIWIFQKRKENTKLKTRKEQKKLLKTYCRIKNTSDKIKKETIFEKTNKI